MNYKRLIKNRNVRRKILQLFSFVPDKTMLVLQYYLKFGRKLNLKNPQRYTEKIQKYKLEYRNPLLVQCVDKWEVREYIKAKGLSNILNECYGVFSSEEEVDFELFPEEYVLKDTLAGGGNAVIIIKQKPNKEQIDIIKSRLHEWVTSPYRKKSGGREWPYYSGKKHRILAEAYIRSDETGLTDYKFFCFDGAIACVYVISNREMGGHGDLAIMDREFVRLPYQSATQGKMKEDPVKPQNYEYMIEVVEKLSRDFPHVRVDLYNIDGKVIFGELTFYGASGYQKFIPDEFDYILGQQFKI